MTADRLTEIKARVERYVEAAARNGSQPSSWVSDLEYALRELAKSHYYVQTFWSPDRKFLVTAHVYTPDGEYGNAICLQDDDGIEWEAAGEQQDINVLPPPPAKEPQL